VATEAIIDQDGGYLIYIELYLFRIQRRTGIFCGKDGVYQAE
jgi:hypothetical protein